MNRARGNERLHSEQLLLVLDIVRKASRGTDPPTFFRLLVTTIYRELKTFSHVSLFERLGDGEVVAMAVAGEGSKDSSVTTPAGSAIRETFSSSTSFLSNDLRREARHPSPVARLSRSALCIPIRGEGRVHAVLNLESREANAFESQDVALFEILCEHLAHFIEAARLCEEARTRSEMIRKVTEICRRVIAAGSVDEAVRAAVRAVVEECGYHAACIAFLDRDAAHMIHRAHHARVPVQVKPGYRQPVGAGIVGETARTRRPVCSSDTENDPRYVALLPGVRSELCVPLLAGDRLIGVLDVNAAVPDAFGAEEIDLMETLGGLLAVLVEKAETSHTREGSVIGRITGGVVHELNNLLAGVIGHAQLLAGKECPDSTRRSLERIHDEARRCHRIVQNLLAFAQERVPEMTLVSVNDLVEGALELRAYQLRVDDITLVKRLSPDLPRTLGDFHRLQQAFMSLLATTHEALQCPGRGGTLTVATALEGESIRISVENDGPEIAEERLARVFEQPPASPLPGDDGEDIGLAICQGIVSQHEGSLRAESSAGGGTRFLMDLPVRRPAAAGAFEPAPETGVRRLLVVDDEPSIVEVLSETLRALGHDVDCASNGSIALDKIREGRYDAVISDLKMPGMSGQDLFGQVSRSDPALAGRFVFATGDLVARETREFLERSGRPWLEKPFLLDDLVAILGTVLPGAR